jgi:hypothetical protein
LGNQDDKKPEKHRTCLLKTLNKGKSPARSNPVSNEIGLKIGAGSADKYKRKKFYGQPGRGQKINIILFLNE